MGRISDNRAARRGGGQGQGDLRKAIALIDQLNGTLDMERGGQVAENLRSLYEYMMARLTLANATNDARIVARSGRRWCARSRAAGTRSSTDAR